VRDFTGGFYRWFILAFVELTSPLTDLTQKGASDLVQWIEQCQLAFEKVEKGSLWGASLIYSSL